MYYKRPILSIVAEHQNDTEIKQSGYLQQDIANTLSQNVRARLVTKEGILMLSFDFLPNGSASC